MTDEGLAPFFAAFGPFEDPTNVCRRWRLQADDLNVQDVVRRLEITWHSWSFEQRLLLLDAAEAVAAAETARTNRILTVEERRRFERLARQSVNAATFALELGRCFPPPWADSTAPIGELVLSLVEFAISGLQETTRADYNVGMMIAHRRLVELKKKTPSHAGRVSAGFVGELAWLAGGQRAETPPDESTVRRYAKGRKLALPPGAEVWRKAWPQIRAAATLARGSNRPLEGFAPLIREYLRGSRIQ